jgi:hypothetical protein
MKLLQVAGFLVSLGFAAAGVVEFLRLGMNSAGAMAFLGGAVVAFSISITLWIFDLRNRITTLERTGAQPRPGS